MECWWDAHGMLVGCSWGAPGPPGPPGPRSAARSAGAAGAGLPSNAGYLVSRGAIRSSRGCPGVDPGRLPYEARNDPGFDAKHVIKEILRVEDDLPSNAGYFIDGIEKSHDFFVLSCLVLLNVTN